jgi:hypothetical protein
MAIFRTRKSTAFPGCGWERLLIVDARNGTVAAPSEREIRAARERIVASPSFRTSPQLASFLSFVVEETLAGNAKRLKGYTIAIGALGRADSFDPQNSPIVRVEATRLRRSLENYYSGPGRDDQVVIDLPVGGYIPSFVRQEDFLDPRLQPVSSRGWFGNRGRRYRFVVFVASVAVAASAMFDLIVVLAVYAIGGHTAP